MTTPCIRFATPRAAALALGLLAACEGTPGASRIQVLLAAKADPLWEHRLAAESFYLDREVPGDDILRVSTSDFCWDANVTIDFDRRTGVRRSEEPSQSFGEAGGCLGALDPPTACARDCPVQRVTLSNAEQVDICRPLPDLHQLPVTSVATRTERFVLDTQGSVRVHVFGDVLLLERLNEAAITGARPGTGLAAFSLDNGASLWSWATPPEQLLHVAGGDAEHAYVLSEPSRETYAFGLPDGALVWQKNFGCEWLSLAEDLLVCGETLRRTTCEHE